LSRFLFGIKQWKYKRKESAPNFKTPVDSHPNFSQNCLLLIPMLD